MLNLLKNMYIGSLIKAVRENIKCPRGLPKGLVWRCSIWSHATELHQASRAVPHAAMAR